MTDLNTIFAWLCKSTVQISILILLIVAVRIVLRNKLAARWQYWLWLIVLVRMFMPALPQSSISLFNLLPDTTPVAQTQPETITSPPVTPAPTNTDVTLAPADPQPNPAEVAPIAPAHQLAIQSKPPLNINYTAILLTCWSIGAALLAAHIMLTNFKFWRKVKSLRQLTDNKILDTLEDCKAKMGIETVIGVVVTDAIKSPALFGFLRPRLLLPSDLVDKLTPAQLRHIFFHELAHLKRCDIYISWLTALMQIVHWFNPFVWFAFYQMRADREMACDSLALSMMGNDTPSDYGRTIVSLLENYANREYVPAMAGILESKSNLKQRISMIARFKQGAYKWSPLAAIILVTLCCIGLVDAKRKPAKTPFTKTLANGIQVQLIGVCEHPGKQGQKNRYKNTTWWSPDGNPLDYQLYDHTGGWVAVRDGERGYEFTAKITNAPDDINARMKVIPSGSSVGGGSSRPDMYGSQLKDLRYIGTVLNKDLQTCNVSVGIASGLWQTVAQSRKSKVDGSWGSPSSGTEDGSIAFTKPFETDGKTTITVTHEMNKSDVRLIAVTLDGREHKPTRSSASGGSFTQVTFTYPLKLEHIKSFKLQKRSYQWTKFKNVKLIPDDKKIVKDVTSNQNIMNPKVLNNGISVELLGVCEHPNKKSKHRDSTTDDNYFCWTPDGKLLDGQLYDSPIVKGMNIDEGKRGYEFVARITNAPNDTSAVFDVSPRGSSLATSGLPKFVNDDSQAAGPLKHICYAQTCLDENITTCNVSVGIASGPWQTVSKSIKISNDGKWMSSFGIGNRGAVAFAVPVEMDGETTVSVTHEMGNSDIRMIALDINDKEYRVLRNTSKGNKGFTQLTAIFDIKLDQVKSFVLQERKYQWEKFKNVVLLSKDDLPNGKIMLWVEDFFKNNYKDITARKTIRWADYKQHDNGNQSIRYKYEAEIHNKDKIINNEIFEFDKDGKFVSVKDADAENYVQGWVEDFFANNYRDITARKTISFSDVTEHDNDNVSITYKYEATIRNKDKVINNQIFTFDKNGKFISVEDVASIDLSLPELTAPASSSKRVSYALSKIESLFRRIDSASEEQLLASAGYFDQINEFCDDLQGKNGQTLPRAEWGKLSGADVDSALKIIAQLENTAEGCRDLADGKHTQLLNDHYKTLKKQYTQLCAALRPGSASNTTAANSIEQYLGTWDMVEIRGFAVDHIKSMTVVINSDYTMSFEFPDKEDKSEATKLPWVFENGYLLIDDEYFANLDDGLLRIISGLHSITGDGNVIILKKKTQKPISNAIEPYLGVWNSVEIKGKRVDHMVSYTLTIDPDGTMLAETTDNKGEFHASKGTCIFKNGRLVMEDGGEDIYISLADGLLSLTGEDSKIILKKKTPQIQTYSIEPYLGIWDAVEVKGKDTDEIKTVAVEIYSDNTLSIEFTDNEGIFKAVKRVWTLKDGKMIVNGGDATATLADGLLTMSGDGTTVTLKKRKINSAANSMDPFLGTWTLVDVKGQDSDDIVTLNITITSDGNITIEGTDKKGKNKSETVKYTLRNGRLYIDEDQGLVTLKRDQLILNAGNKIITLKKIASQQSTNAIEPYLGTWHLVEITGKEAKNIVSLSVTINSDATMLVESTDNEGDFHSSTSICVFKNNRLVVEDEEGEDEDIIITLKNEKLTIEGDGIKAVLKKKFVTTTGSIFAPVVELIVKPDDNSKQNTIIIDIETGRTISVPDDLIKAKDIQKIMSWSTATGAAFSVKLRGQTCCIGHLAAFSVQVTNGKWQSLTALELKNNSELQSGTHGYGNITRSLDQLPRTYIFKTSQNNIGIMLLTPAPPGLKIQYKLLAKTNSSENAEPKITQADCIGTWELIDISYKGTEADSVASATLTLKPDGTAVFNAAMENGTSDIDTNKYLVKNGRIRIVGRDDIEITLEDGLLKLTENGTTGTFRKSVTSEKDNLSNNLPAITESNYQTRKATGFLPTVETNIDNPIVQVINEKNNEIVYTIRIKGRKFEPKIFEKGSYTIKVGPSLETMKTIRGIGPQKEPYGLARIEF